MTLRDYLEILRHSWVLVVATAVGGALAALGLSLLTTPIYQAKAQMFVSVRAGEEISNAYSGGLYVQQRIKSYLDVVDSPGVLAPVISKLGLDVTPVELAPSVAAQNPPNTVLLSVTASDASAEQSAELANATAAALAAEIVRLETTESGAKPVRAELIKPAQVPNAPISPRTRLNIALGGLLGLMLGVGIAILRRTLDTTVKSTAELDQITGAVSLGVVTFDPEASGKPLVTLSSSPRAEAFRSVRTNLRYVAVDSPPRTVVITSSLPSEGKTTTACNLAIALAQAGSKVLLLEADLRRPKVAEYLEVDGAVGLTDVLIGQVALSDVIVPWRDALLDFLPSGAIPPNPSELLGSKQMSELLAELSERYDIVILDAPPLLPVTDAAILARASDGAILIARYGDTRQEQVAAAAEALHQVGARVLGTVMNFAPTRKRGSKYGYGGAYGYGYGYGYGQEYRSVSGNRRVLGADEVPAPEPIP